MRTSDYRRHQMFKRRKKALKIAKSVFNMKEEDAIDFSLHYSNDLKMCSCPMCGNPRKHFNEKTIQEIKSIEKFQAEINEIINSSVG